MRSQAHRVWSGNSGAGLTPRKEAKGQAGSALSAVKMYCFCDITKASRAGRGRKEKGQERGTRPMKGRKSGKRGRMKKNNGSTNKLK